MTGLPMTRIAKFIPRPLLFVLVGIVQVGLIAYMVVDRASALRAGTEVTLETRPVDPRDFLRGDYVVLNYAISTIDAGALTDTVADGKGTAVYVRLAPGDGGLHRAVSVHRERIPVAAPEVLIGGRVTSGTNCGADDRRFCASLLIKYGIERYFVPEGEGLAIERARNTGKVTVVAAVTPSGRAVIKRLLVDGQPVYDEPPY
jgi:uncharacterized membrane-anchored protein